MSSCRSARSLITAVAVASLAVLVFTAAPAFAQRPYQSQLTQANGSALSSPMGLTVDNSNDLWVTEATGGGTVDKYSPTGTYEAQTASPPWSGSYIESAAFSAAAGKVFISDSNADDLWGLTPADASYSGTDLNSGLGGGCCYLRVAADNSGGAANGDLYVSKGSAVVRVDGSGAAANFTSAEPYVSGNELTGPFSSAGALAVDANGDLYVAAGSKVYIFEPSGTLAREITEFEGSPLGSITAIALDPSNEDVLLAEEGAIDEFSSSGESLAKITEANGAAFHSIQGLAVSSTGTLYVADRGAGAVDVFGPAPSGTAAKLPLAVSVTGNGSVTSSPSGISCVEENSPCSAEFKEGKTVTLTARPARGNHFVEWLGSPCDESTATTCEVEMSAAQSLSAKFAPTMQTLTVIPSGGGSVSATTGAIAGCEQAGGGDCSGQYQETSTVNLTATPAAHNHVTWSGCASVPSADTCEVAIGSSAASVNAEFSVNTHTLTIAHTGLGSVSANEGAISGCAAASGTCAGIYSEASTVTLTATPAAHKHVEWTSGCTHQPSADVCEVTIGPGDETVNVSFRPNTHELTVIPDGQGVIHAESGSISHCSSAGGSCAGVYIEAATVTLVANPAAHQTVVWTGCKTVPSPNTCYALIGEGDSVVEISFVQASYSLTVVKSGGGEGSVSCNGGPCAGNYPEGTSLTLNALAARGSNFAGWGGAPCVGIQACQITIEADTSITATFDANQRTSPSEERCVVPPLSGKTLRQARSALSVAHCSLGNINRPRRRSRHKVGPLVVRSSSPAAGTNLPSGGDVALRLEARAGRKARSSQ